MRRKKMATNWSSLPSVIIVEILNKLSLPERLSASLVSKRWRSCILHPKLWRNCNLKLYIQSRKRSNLADVSVKFARELLFIFQARSPIFVREFVGLIGLSSWNSNVQSISLQPSSFRVEWPERLHTNAIDLLLHSIVGLIVNSRCLKRLSLGCLNDITDHADQLLKYLAKNQSQNLQSLYLCSVKEDPYSYGLIFFPGEIFSHFSYLRQLGIDYDYLTNTLLLSFCNNNRKQELQKLVIHVHGVDQDRENITNLTWKHIVSANPNLAVTLNFIHSVDGIINIMDILQPAMPLTTLRMFYCQDISVAAIDFISQHMSDSFQCLHIIEGMAGYEEPNVYDHSSDENPFVMLAWKCDQLKELTLIGYQIDRDDIVAISRLRSKTLKILSIPGCCISDTVEYSWGVRYHLGRVDNELLTEVSTNLGKPWEPLDHNAIPKAVFDVTADCEQAYIDLLLSDQL